MNFFRLALVFALPLGLALACGDDDGNSPGFGGTPDDNSGGSAGSDGNAGTDGFSGSGNNTAGSNAGSSGSGNSNPPSANAMAVDVCRRGCAKTEPLNCPNDDADCEGTCLEEFENFPEECQPAVLTWGNCAANRPASDYLCDEDGESNTREGVCQSEAEAALTCLIPGLGEL